VCVCVCVCVRCLISPLFHFLLAYINSTRNFYCDNSRCPQYTLNKFAPSIIFPNTHLHLPPFKQCFSMLLKVNILSDENSTKPYCSLMQSIIRSWNYCVTFHDYCLRAVVPNSLGKICAINFYVLGIRI
jgi:hypothetical protein